LTADLLGASAGRLSDRLQEAPTWSDRFSLVDGFIRDRVARARGAAPQIMWAWRRLQHPDGARRIGAIAEEVGWSSKRLIAGFREQIGLPPKALARIIRFDRVVRWLDDLKEVRWAELAHRAGYFDQAHFNRDFRQLAGRPPGDFLRRRLAGEGGILED
jgi:AraC-like DNA-binding protein